MTELQTSLTSLYELRAVELELLFPPTATNGARFAAIPADP
ncbi:hypothetical protein [Rhodococcus sp. AJR001]|nr:hypothetical protein [Rhodococcus sp. AJR001]